MDFVFQSTKLIKPIGVLDFDLTTDPTLPIRCANVYGDVVYGMHNKDGNTLKQVYEVLLEAVK